VIAVVACSNARIIILSQWNAVSLSYRGVIIVCATSLRQPHPTSRIYRAGSALVDDSSGDLHDEMMALLNALPPLYIIMRTLAYQERHARELGLGNED
jgi:prephenate dehydrogenase